MTDLNQNTIEEFRANEGKVGGYFEGRPILLLHHKGAQSGVERVNPVMYETLDNGFAVFASKAGADTNPDWYHNLKANSETTVEVGSETIPVKARIADPQEREPIWSRWKHANPNFAEYETKTSREIPVVILDRR
ncbi:MAG: nitroreductase family deazaflavin-dependent oxidoreductase [Actinobacteria bacterium]|nr:nitroreductase family deazaflavin-dependent oxidoreductase [Actinomycetota bacterium]